MITTTYNDDLARVRIVGTDIFGQDVLVERSTNQINWKTVRGGRLKLDNGGFRLDDYEFTPGVTNYYRARPNVESTVLDISGTAVTPGDGGFENINGFSAPFSIANKFIRLTLTVSDWDNVDDLSFYLGINGYTDHIRWYFAGESIGQSNMGKNGEAFSIDLKQAEIRSVSGDVAMSSKGKLLTTNGFTDMRLRASDNGDAYTVRLHKAELVNAGSEGGHVSITFDDNWTEVGTLAKPKMDALGFKGTTYVIAETLGQTGRSTKAEIDAMHADGWEIGGHSYDSSFHSSSYTGVSSTAASDDLSNLYNWLDANYPNADKHYSFAYPHGRYQDTTDGKSVEKLVESAGFRSARTTLSPVGQPYNLQIAGIPEVMPYRIHGTSGISEKSLDQRIPDNLVDEGGMLDKLEQNPGGWMPLVFHKIVDDSGELLTNAEFETDASDWHAFSGATLGWDAGRATVTPPSSDIPSIIEFGRPSATRPSVTPGKKYRIEASASMAWQLDLQPVLRWYDAGGSVISDTEGDIYPSVWNGGATMIVEGTAPAGAASVSPRIWMHNAPSSAYVMRVEYFRMKQLGEATTSTEIGKADFDMIMDAIAERNLTVLTVREVMTLSEHSTSIKPSIDKPWLKSVTRPFLNHSFMIQSISEVQRRGRSGVFDVVGRSKPIAVNEVRSARQFSVEIITNTEQEARDLEYILASGDTLYLQAPRGSKLPTLYAVVGDTTQDRYSQSVDGSRTRFILPLVEVATPDADLVGSTVNWNALLSDFTSWGDLLDRFDSWGAVLDYVADAEDVIVE